MDNDIKTIISELEAFSSEIREKINHINDLESLDKIRSETIGKKGKITLILKSLSEKPIEYRRQVGKFANMLNDELKLLFDNKMKDLKYKITSNKFRSGKLDLTLPTVQMEYTHLHPITQMIYEITDIFISLGFCVATGPEIETDYYNFEALNIPKYHPARDMQDTLYIEKNNSDEQLLLRTHTSPGQIHFMENNQPPFKVVIPGKVYRHDALDSSHSFVFHQIEGLAVDTNLTFTDLLDTLTTFVKILYSENTKVKLIPSYFPFTEPSAELVIECIFCRGNGCNVCKNSGWLEMCGCGMVHPNVFRTVGYDPEKYSGYAFGLGVERFAMLKYNIDDIRAFFENDLRLLKQL